ncbi:hypothetical protein BOCO_0037 [Bombiscardovia coagulans]|uniref:Uncharacterized protein n=1 Tax=Bombiscardovia coagulans TaxID=686666 RepID=A0A261EVF5_9BIFI|nr:hypothetical protein BOCO_0037 [Bombiscardovia coagulans]
MAQDGLQGLHVRAGLDRQGSVSVMQGVDDQALDILPARVPQGRRPYLVPPFGGGLPTSSRPAQQIILGTMAIQTSS